MTDRQALRENILDRARIGAITGDDADAEAERLGLGRFSQKPDPNIFNPLDEWFWSLPMVLAWIAWRTPDPVRDVWYLYCEQCWHSIWRQWRVGPGGDIQEGWHLEQRHRPNVGTVKLSADFDAADPDAQKVLMPIPAAQEELGTAMKEGVLKANAIDERSGKYVDIPPLDWHQLVPTISSSDQDELRLGLLGRGYKDALF